MQEIVQYLFSGITTGAVYAVIAVGLSMLYSSTELINFAHGEFVMIGALAMVTLWVRLSLPLPLAVAGAVTAGGILGLVFERLAIRTARNPEPITLIIITVGAGIFLKGAAMIVWGKDPFSMPSFSSHESIEIFGAALLPQSIWIVTAALVLAGGIHLFLKQTLTGKAMVACAVNKKAAWLSGIPSEKMGILAFGISAGCGAVAGIFIAPITMSSYDMGTILGLKGFCAAMIGGLGSLWGAFAGGLLLGILESLGAGLISSGLKDAIAFVLLLLILYIRPGGLFAAKEAKRFQIMRDKNKYIWIEYLGFICAMSVFGLVTENTYYLQIMTFIGINTILGLGLNMLMGYTGQVSLGHAAFYGIGAYTTAILSGTYGINPWLALVCAVAAAVLIAFIVGLPTLRLSGYYLAMGTLGFGMIVNIVIREWADVTGGASGFVGIPVLEAGSLVFMAGPGYYFLVWGIVCIAMIICRRLLSSRTGRALRAIHDGEKAAVAIGINTHFLKLEIFMFSAALGAIAGFLYAHFVLFISPESFGFMFSIKIVTMVVIGGMASVWGALLGAAVLTLLPEVLHGFAEYEMIIFGTVLMVVMIFMPQGLTRGIMDMIRTARRAKA